MRHQQDRATKHPAEGLRARCVEAGIVTFEVAFLPYTVLPSGRTVADDATPLVGQAYEQGQVAPLQIEAPGN